VSHGAVGHATVGHHFNVAHWAGGHFGDVHHFGGLHHGGHGLLHHGGHGVLDYHHDLHFYPFFSLGFYARPYPYYYSDLYYGPPYYAAPVYTSTNYPATNAISGTGATVGSYRTQTRAGDASQKPFPDVFMPRIELPCREAPEALPDEPK
jgi:hypothetical protein